MSPDRKEGFTIHERRGPRETTSSVREVTDSGPALGPINNFPFGPFLSAPLNCRDEGGTLGVATNGETRTGVKLKERRPTGPEVLRTSNKVLVTNVV